jgi:hypothetical protein
MQKRSLREVKWLGLFPAITVSTSCNREFKVPMTALRSMVRTVVKL